MNRESADKDRENAIQTISDERHIRIGRSASPNRWCWFFGLYVAAILIYGVAIFLLKHVLNELSG